MEVDVDDASRRYYPTKIEVEEVNTIQKRLIYAWERKVCHSTKLPPEQGANVDSWTSLAHVLSDI